MFLRRLSHTCWCVIIELKLQFFIILCLRKRKVENEGGNERGEKSGDERGMKGEWRGEWRGEKGVRGSACRWIPFRMITAKTEAKIIKRQTAFASSRNLLLATVFEIDYKHFFFINNHNLLQLQSQEIFFWNSQFFCKKIGANILVGILKGRKQIVALQFIPLNLTVVFGWRKKWQ